MPDRRRASKLLPNSASWRAGQFGSVGVSKGGRTSAASDGRHFPSLIRHPRQHRSSQLSLTFGPPISHDSPPQLPHPQPQSKILRAIMKSEWLNDEPETRLGATIPVADRGCSVMVVTPIQAPCPDGSRAGATRGGRASLGVLEVPGRSGATNKHDDHRVPSTSFPEPFPQRVTERGRQW